MILAVFTSLFNGVNYQVSDDKPYGLDQYYTITEEEAPDYRVYYNKDFVAESNTSGCKTKNYKSNGKYVAYGNIVPTYRGYWLLDGEVAKLEDLQGQTLNFGKSGSYIICPYDATLLSKSETNDGHNMIIQIDLDGKSYILTFADMDRWYCCMSRTNPLLDAGGNEVWAHTSMEQCGHQFKAGNVLGRATDETSVTITSPNSSELVTFYDMYNN